MVGFAPLDPEAVLDFLGRLVDKPLAPGKDVERAAPECLDVVGRELPNVRAALDHATSAPDPDHDGLRLMTALAFF